MIHLLAVLGMLSISFSAVFVRLAAVSPVTATLFRGAYAAPVLFLVWFAQRRSDARTARDRWLAFASGLILAIDLNLWHESIALIGAGLGTLIANVQVVFVALAAWILHGERQSPLRVATIALVLGGITMTSGLARGDAYGARPVAGAIVGVLAGLSYAAFLLVYRAANQARAPRVGPLLDSTLGMVVGAVVSSIFDPHFTWNPSARAHMWLALLALGPQVIGWQLLGAAIAKLPATETSVILLGQPVVTIIWGVVIFDERLSTLQWLGAALVLAGIATLGRQSQVASRKSPVEP